MKTFISLAACSLLVLAACSPRQPEPAQPQPEGSAPASQSGAAAAHANWLTDFPAAQAKAKSENKLVLMDFTGSDWCPPCMQLTQRVFESKEFEAFASENLVLVEVDFPQRKKLSAELEKANEALAEKFGVQAFPTVIILNSDGKQLVKWEGYGGEGPAEFIGKVKKLKN